MVVSYQTLPASFWLVARLVDHDGRSELRSVISEIIFAVRLGKPCFGLPDGCSFGYEEVFDPLIPGWETLVVSFPHLEEALPHCDRVSTLPLLLSVEQSQR